MYSERWKVCMKSTEEIVLIRYYNVLFYLFFEVGIDDLKRQCLVNRIGSGEPIRMKKIQEWCHCHQIPFIVSAQHRLSTAVNSAMVTTYWEIGEQIFKAQSSEKVLINRIFVR